MNVDVMSELRKAVADAAGRVRQAEEAAAEAKARLRESPSDWDLGAHLLAQGEVASRRRHLARAEDALAFVEEIVPGDDEKTVDTAPTER